MIYIGNLMCILSKIPKYIISYYCKLDDHHKVIIAIASVFTEY